MRLGRISLLVLAAFAASCSTYSGAKLGLDPAALKGKPPKQKEVPPVGVPYQMVRPRFDVTFAPPAADGGEPTYTIGVVYEPDPAQRYSLTVDPGYFANPDFSLTFNPSGALTIAKSVTAETLTPSIKAVGTLASTLAAFGVLDESDTASAISAAVANVPCTGPDVESVDYAALEVKKLSAKEALQARLADFARKDDELKSRFHYRTESERACLSAVLTAFGATVDNSVKEGKRKFDEEAAKLSADPEFLARIRALVAANDGDKIKAEQEANNNLPNAALSGSRTALLDLAANLITYQKAKLPKDILLPILGMNETTWRARHLAYLEESILRVKLALQRHPKPPARTADTVDRSRVETYLSRLETARIETIGAVELLARRKRLIEILEKADLVVDPTGKNAAAYATARAELDVVDERVDALRTKVVAAAKAPAAKTPQAYRDRRAVVVSSDSIATILANSRKSDWNKKIVPAKDTAQIDAPEIIIVLEPLP